MTLNDYVIDVHLANEKWWTDLATGQRKQRNVGEMLMLITSELAEALEGDRKNLQDDHLPQYRMFDVELVDALIRLLDLMGSTGMDAEEIFRAKMAYNATRADHQLAHRMAAGGKKY